MRLFLLGLIVGGGVATTAMLWLYGGAPQPAPAPVARSAAPASAPEPAPLPAATPPTAAATDGIRRAKDDAAATLRVQRNALQREVKALKGRLADQTATLEHYIGKPLEFPADLDALYREEALMKRFSAAIEAIGAEGEVTEIDCSEFPCVVYGKLQNDDGSTVRRMRDADALSVYDAAMDNMSVWAGQAVVDGKPTKNAAFGIAIMPEGSADREAVGKRLRFRHQVYWSAVRAELMDAE